MTTSAEKPTARDLGSPTVLLATWGGLGLAPWAPGTVGSLGALPLVWASQYLPFWMAFSGVGLLLALGIWASNEIERCYGGHDHGYIVIDEVVGQWLAIAIPLQLLEGWLSAPWVYGLGFALFRLFDILKPPPVNWADAWGSGGWSVMLDDVLAGLLAAAVLLMLPLLLL